MMRCDDVSFTYGNEAKVLQNISVKWLSGQKIAIMGSSGSGKSTLLGLLNSLLTPTTGRIRHQGTIANVFQDGRLIPWKSIGTNVAFGAKSLGVPFTPQDIDTMLEVVGLDPKISHQFPKVLSGGMAQRVGFARALLCRPDWLLLDEPFSALDDLTKIDLIRHMMHDVQVQSLGMILVTHDAYDACRLCDRIYALKAGQLHPIKTIPLSAHQRSEAFVDQEALELKALLRSVHAHL